MIRYVQLNLTENICKAYVFQLNFSAPLKGPVWSLCMYSSFLFSGSSDNTIKVCFLLSISLDIWIYRDCFQVVLVPMQCIYLKPFLSRKQLFILMGTLFRFINLFDGFLRKSVPVIDFVHIFCPTYSRYHIIEKYNVISLRFYVLSFL